MKGSTMRIFTAGIFICSRGSGSYSSGMNCIVTAGPTYEPLDDVRRLTNFSTGRLGTELANYLVARGHKVILLIGEMATYPGERKAQKVEQFSPAADLRESSSCSRPKRLMPFFTRR